MEKEKTTTMTDLPIGIDLETYQRAVMFATDWRPGQRCEGAPGGRDSVRPYCYSCIIHPARLVGHDLDLPPLTDELLMAIIKKGLERNYDFLLEVHYRWGAHPLDAAIILAAASMEKK